MPRDETQPSEREIQARDDRLRDLGTVSGELLHDLGGVLSILVGRVALAREEAALGRLPSEELGRIQSDAEELRCMVLEILDHLRGVRPSLESTFPVQSTLEGVVSRWVTGASSVSTTLESALSADVEVAGPRSFFTRAIGNLLRNAARHAHREIRLTVGEPVGGAGVEIRVEDDGEGVLPALRDQLFQPFISGAEQGTGLGLAFARWGIERLGGSLELDAARSVMGGASFRAHLPISAIGAQLERARRSRPSSRSGRAGATPLSGLRVAIVDDDAAVRRTVGRLLGRSGADVVELDPSRWSSLIHATHELALARPDAILLDLNLQRLSGVDVHRALAHSRPKLAARVVFFTGGAPPPEPAIQPVLNKMVAWDDLIASILGIAGPQR